MNNWNNAIENLKDLMQSNQDFTSTIYQIAETNQFLNNQELYAQAATEINSPLTHKKDPKLELEFLRTTAHTIQKDIAGVDLSAFVEEREDITKNYSQLRSKFLEVDRNFGDIVKDGPKSAVEETLLVSAIAFLEPQDFKKAITNGKKATEVASMIDVSKIKQFTDIVMNELGDDRVKQVESKESESIPNPLGVKTGFLDSLQHGLENTSVVQDASLDDVKAPSTPDRVNNKGSGRFK